MHATLPLMRHYGFPAIRRARLETLQLNLKFHLITQMIVATRVLMRCVALCVSEEFRVARCGTTRTTFRTGQRYEPILLITLMAM